MQVVEQFRQAYGTGVIPLHMPIGTEDNFNGIVDVISRTAYRYENGKPVEIPVPEEMKDELETYRTNVIDAAIHQCSNPDIFMNGTC